MMKRFLLCTVFFFSLCGFAQAQNTTIAQTQVNVTDTGKPSFWGRVGRIAARVGTLGMVQAAADSIRRDTPFTMVADHDGIDTSAYNLKVNTQLAATLPVTALANGTIRFPFPQGLPRGSYTLIIEATGEGGTTPSSPLSLTVTAGNPNAPRNPRIER